MRNKIPQLLAVSLLLGLSPLAAESVIRHGIDVFTTPSDGRTYYDFAQNPIPAGFFCRKSEAFAGRVAFKGLPIATEASGQLRGADTVVERLDDAVFDASGSAVTRIQFRALSLVSIAPVKTPCGAFHVYVSLDDRQPVTKMRIHRTEERGGSFDAPLALNVHITFIPVKPTRNKDLRTLELHESITFPVIPIPWSFVDDGVRTKRISSAFVDTNGDLTPDTLLPGTSNFSPGVSPGRRALYKFGDCPACPEFVCHAADGEEHCYYDVPPDCWINVCPL
jgi:hypothetical protein